MKKSIENNCPRCHKEPAQMHAVFGILLGRSCREEDEQKRKSTTSPEFYSQTQQTRVQQQRDNYEKDMLPPYDHNGKPNEEFARAYPEKAKELYSEYERVTGKTTDIFK